MENEQLKMNIEKNYSDIVATVLAEDIMDRFVDEDYLTIHDVVEKIMNGKTKQEQMKTLIQLLNEKLKKNPEIFDFFLKQLAENRNDAYHALEKKIRETEKKPIQVSEAGTDDSGYPEIPEKLRSRPVTEKQAMFLSKTFSPRHLHAFGTCLDFNEVEISHIEADYRKYASSTVIQQLIIKWKNRTGCSATLGKLLDIFMENSDLIDLHHEEYVKALEKINQ
ncbi:uncharacterized protein [Argopecten irradians]|uniref:uncharacterized protein isoform X2 n=1 Tax=Argopecten irradians TaxID=31199 RepID=UPI0037234960